MIRSIVVSLTLGLSAATAQAFSCTPRVQVETLPLVVTEHSDVSIAEVTRINQASSHALTRSGVGLGSTVMRSVVNARIEEDWLGCPTVRLQAGYPSMKVYIARELTANSCAYDHVRRHELEHVDIYRRWLAVLPQRLEMRLLAELPEVMRLPAAKRLDRILTSSLAEMALVQPQHDALDSPEEYQHNSVACDGFVGKLVDQLKAEGGL